MPHRLIDLICRASLPGFLALNSCSVFLDFEDTQCTTNESCWDLGPEFAATTCVENYCRFACESESECGPGFSCVDSVCVDSWACFDDAPDRTTSEEVDLAIPFLSVLGAPLRDIAVDVCAMEDVTCEEPVAELATDEEGQLHVSLPADFRGYLLTEGTEYFDQIDVLPSPLVAGMTMAAVTLQEEPVTQSLAEAVGSTLDPERGQVVFTVHSCTGPGSGIAIESLESDSETVPFYFVDGKPTADASRTTEQAAAGFVNFPAGQASLRATDENGRQVFRGDLLVRKRTITVVALYPVVDAEQEASSSAE